MSRIIGKQVIKAVCCGTKLSIDAYGSINSMMQEIWTDGKIFGSLYPTDGGLRRCICGQYFLLSESEYCEIIRSINLLDSPSYEKRIESWLSKEKIQTQLGRNYINQKEENIIKKNFIPPVAQIISDKNLYEIINSKYVNYKILIIARRRYWRYLNDSYRIEFRKYNENKFKKIPTFIINDDQKSNMLSLLRLLENCSDYEMYELIELHRELGNLKTASEILTKVKDHNNFCKISTKLIDLKISAPAILN